MGTQKRLFGKTHWAKKASLAACGLAFSMLPAFGQPLPEPPSNSDIAFRILPANYSTAKIDQDVLREQPLVRLVVEGGGSLLGIDPVWDLLNTFDGTVLGAILSDPKKGSNLARYFQDSELRSRHASMIAEMQSLASDLELAKAENESGTYPEDLKEYIESVRYYDANLPEGASYIYERLEDGKSFRLKVKYEKAAPIASLGPAPVFGPESFGQNLVITKAPVPLNYAIAVRTKNSETARALADTVWGQSKDGFWTVGADGGLATLRGSWLVISDTKANLGTVLKSVNGQGPGWSKNPGFQRVAKNVNVNAPVVAFVDLPKVLKALGPEIDPEMTKLLGLVGPTGYTLTPRERSEFRVEAFVGVNPPKGSELEGFFKQSASASPQAAMVAENIPWDITNAFAADYRKSKKLFDALVALSPEAKTEMENAEDVWAGFLGLDAERGFDELVDGWAILSFERLDIFVNAIEDVTDMMSGSPPETPIPDEGTGGPESDESETVVVVAEDEVVPSDTDSEGDPEAVAEEPVVEEEASEPAAEIEIEVDEEQVEVVPAGPTKPARIPATVAFQVVDAQAREALTTALDKRIGETLQSKTVHGVEVKGREDGLLSYAVRDNWFYISGGKTQRLLRNLLSAATGQKPSLTSLESWNQFRSGQRGQVLAIGHQKVDGVYSMTKGALLFLGPDFRPLAYEIGGLRDYHSAAFVVPDGLLMVGDVLQGDGR